MTRNYSRLVGSEDLTTELLDMVNAGASGAVVDSKLGGLAWNWKPPTPGLSLSQNSPDQFERVARRAGIMALTKQDEDEIDSLTLGTRTITVALTQGSTYASAASGTFSTYDGSASATIEGRWMIHDRALSPGTYVLYRHSSSSVTMSEPAIKTGVFSIKMQDTTEPYTGDILQYVLAGELTSGTNNNVLFGGTVDSVWSASPQMFLYAGPSHSASTHVLKSGSNFYMDLGSADYRNYFVSQVSNYWNTSASTDTTTRLNSERWQGLILDNVSMSYRNIGNVNSSSVVYRHSGASISASEWRADIYGFLDYLNANLLPSFPGKTLWANIIEPSTAASNQGLISSDPIDGTVAISGTSDYTVGNWWRGIIQKLDGVFLEYFSTDANPPYGYQTHDELNTWVFGMGEYAINELNKPAIIVGRGSARSASSTIDDPSDYSLRNSALAHYLLFAKSNTYFRWGDDSSYFDVILWPSEFDLIKALGPPLGRYYREARAKAGNLTQSKWIFRRDFENGYVRIDHTVSAAPVVTFSIPSLDALANSPTSTIAHYSLVTGDGTIRTLGGPL